MSLIFNQPVKHGRVTILPSVPVAFDDPDAEPFFVNAGWADRSDAAPVHTYSAEDVAVDPATTFADGPHKGRKVLEAGE